jgi:hypothetical protein
MNYFVIFGIIFLAFVTSIVLSSTVMKRLRTRHPDTWEALGKPRRINISDRTTPDGKHFWTAGYKELNDPRFESQVELLKMFNNVFGVIIVTLLVLLVVKLMLGYR